MVINDRGSLKFVGGTVCEQKVIYPAANTKKIQNDFEKRKLRKVIRAKKWIRVFADNIGNLIRLANCLFSLRGLILSSNIGENLALYSV